jgi:hypothetical protein
MEQHRKITFSSPELRDITDFLRARKRVWVGRGVGTPTLERAVKGLARRIESPNGWQPNRHSAGPMVTSGFWQECCHVRRFC